MAKRFKLYIGYKPFGENYSNEKLEEIYITSAALMEWSHALSTSYQNAPSYEGSLDSAIRVMEVIFTLAITQQGSPAITGQDKAGNNKFVYVPRDGSIVYTVELEDD